MTITRMGLLVSSLVALSTSVQADEQALVTQARELLAKHQDSVVWVTAVAKMQIPGRTGEQEAEALGTVIDPSGMVVVAEEAFNPVAKLIKQFSGSLGGGAPAALREMKVDVTGVEIRLSDGTELPAKIVLKDPDLGLAFVMPEKPADSEKAKLPNLSLAETPSVEVLDQVISLGRLGKSLDSQPTLALGRIAAIVKKPRELYWGATGSDGTPVFTSAGKLLGIIITHVDGGTVVVPAGEVSQIAQQALAPPE